MASKNVRMQLSCIFIVLIGIANSELTKDKAECADQLIGIATCLPYVGGDSKTPTLDCCVGLKQVLEKSMKCLCILIKDRNDPDLGLNINATLALSLPKACRAPPNNSSCTDLLHLAPNSPDARIFEEYANTTKTKQYASSNPASSSAEIKSDGGGGGGQMIRKRGFFMIVSGVLIWSRIILTTYYY